ncbi:unnamed protein product [Rhodiola kirilowii]
MIMQSCIEILDNHFVTKPEDIIYLGAVQNLTLNLVAYLKGKGHPYSQLLTKISPVVPLLPWATKKSNNSFNSRPCDTHPQCKNAWLGASFH